MNKVVKITESAYNSFVSEILSESFSPEKEKVLIVKKYLDDNFKRSEIDDIDANGFPTTEKVVIMTSGKTDIKQMTANELLLLLDDKFQSMIKDKTDRKKFLKQVVIDWYNKDIDNNGMLSVNIIN